ncbi:MAG: hypothetical protein B7X35_05085 [Halothiobacillus sp. 14-56-357]|jgi:hypothetical protein|nr:MAG: hypothetical protein B7X44_00865 [Halothiobacillus sp. 15-55-196]OZB56568.1 MAG: hypothetical protein B7X35_05085 [Halothiobacillus sp. 14-56-357]OZB79409.1 MAG: hypothetical protein B7X29_00650 [Halothiobacillus sp. 13-55-115]
MFLMLIKNVGTSKNLLRCPIAASRARSRLAYLLDMSRCSLNAKLAQARGSLHSNMLVTVFQGAHVLNHQVGRSLSPAWPRGQ